MAHTDTETTAGANVWTLTIQTPINFPDLVLRYEHKPKGARRSPVVEGSTSTAEQSKVVTLSA